MLLFIVNVVAMNLCSICVTTGELRGQRGIENPKICQLGKNFLDDAKKRESLGRSRVLSVDSPTLLNYGKKSSGEQCPHRAGIVTLLNTVLMIPSIPVDFLIDNYPVFFYHYATKLTQSNEPDSLTKISEAVDLTTTYIKELYYQENPPEA